MRQMMRWIVFLSLCLIVAAAQADTISWMQMDSGPTRPADYDAPAVDLDNLSQTAVMLSNVPTSTWTYGCSATSAGMIFGYYDRTGYSNMYTGPTNGGLAPLTNLGQGIGGTPIAGSCSIIATQNGFDGRTTRGHVDDYWISSGSNGPDPWQTNGWTEHTWGDCTADYMGTNQWKWDTDQDGSIDSNFDGATTLWSYNSNAKLYDYTPPATIGLPQTALCHGMRLFAESRGYTVSTNYTQKIDTLYAGGFSFSDYMIEIDSGCPVMVQVAGHSMVGVGYDSASSLVYLHDTWDNSVHSMAWGGSYSSMSHQAMTVLRLAPLSQPVPEPVSVVFFGSGVVAVFGLVSRRRFRTAA